MAQVKQGAKGVYFIVNPSGCVHECTRAHAKWRLGTAGWRLATAAEIEAYQSADSQRFDRPIAQPFEPLPDIEPDLEDDD